MRTARYAPVAAALLYSFASAGGEEPEQPRPTVQLSLMYEDRDGEARSVKGIDYKEMCQKGTGRWYLVAHFNPPLDPEDYRIAGTIEAGEKHEPVSFNEFDPAGPLEEPASADRPIIVEDAAVIQQLEIGKIQVEKGSIHSYIPDKGCDYLGMHHADSFNVTVTSINPESGEDKITVTEKFPVRYCDRQTEQEK